MSKLTANYIDNRQKVGDIEYSIYLYSGHEVSLRFYDANTGCLYGYSILPTLHEGTRVIFGNNPVGAIEDYISQNGVYKTCLWIENKLRNARFPQMIGIVPGGSPQEKPESAPETIESNPMDVTRRMFRK